MSIERKQFLVWLALLITVYAAAEILWRTRPEFFGPERPGIYRQLPIVRAFPGPR